MEAAWKRRGRCVEAPLQLSAVAWGRRYGGVGAAWGLLYGGLGAEWGRRGGLVQLRAGSIREGVGAAPEQSEL